MKKLFLFGAFLLSVLTIQSIDSQAFASWSRGGWGRGFGIGFGAGFGFGRGWGGGWGGYNRGYNNWGYGSYGFGNFGGYNYAGSDCGGCDQPTGECYCKYVQYEPCYYCTPRCVQEVIPCTKTCCRYVPRYYEIQRCRYVPEYYTDTICRQEPEYYQVDDSRVCTRIEYDQNCTYVPRYYWKHTCCDAGASCCPTTSCCP